MGEATAQRRASLHTLGCRLNQYETQLIGERLAAAGYRLVPHGEPVELGIINTCTVTAQADLKARYEIRKFLRRSPGAFLAVVGCYSHAGYRELAGIEGVDLILGNHDKLNVLDYIGEGTKLPEPLIVRERIDPSDFTIAPVGDLPATQRANLKVQDGCDFVCSFCIIPFVRGRARARAFGNLLDEARSLIERGARELVLTGVNLGTYQCDGYTLTDVVDALAALAGLERVRISSIEPTTVDEGLLERMADPAHALQPFLHLPLQSGCDAVLRKMRRRYSSAEYSRFARMAVDRVPGLCLGTDILVGSPGEDAAAFEQTCRFFRDGPFAYTHVFTYSQRPGTLAARGGGHVPMAERQRRGARLRALSQRQRRAFYRRHLGCEAEVLFETPREGYYPGYTSNYIRVMVPAPADGRDIQDRLGTVRLERLAADAVEGTLLALEPGASSAGLVAAL